MKKFLAILLAMLLVLVNVAALAEDPDPNAGTDGATTTADWETEGGETFDFTVTKNYEVIGSTDTTLFPAETLNFTSVPDSGNPTDVNLSVAAYTVTKKTGNEKIFKVTYPKFKKVGVYKFNITEDEGDTQGVTYNTNSITVNLSVLVTYDYDNNCLKIENQGVTAKGKDENGKPIKDDQITNQYDLGSLEITKTVTGNLGKKDQPFTITVEFKTETDKKVWSDITVAGGAEPDNAQTITGNGWTGTKTITIKLMDKSIEGEKVVISNIPAGVSYTVKEDEETHTAADPNGSNGAAGYTVSYDGNETGTIASATAATTDITNDKNIEIDTGISLDSVPYMVLMTIALAGVVMLVLRRREDY